MRLLTLPIILPLPHPLKSHLQLQPVPTVTTGCALCLPPIVSLYSTFNFLICFFAYSNATALNFSLQSSLSLSNFVKTV